MSYAAERLRLLPRPGLVAAISAPAEAWTPGSTGLAAVGYPIPGTVVPDAAEAWTGSSYPSSSTTVPDAAAAEARTRR